MSACVHSPEGPRGSAASASFQARAEVTRSTPSIDRERTRPTLTSTHAARASKAKVAMAPAVYAPMPGMLHTAYGIMNRFGVGWDGGIGERADSFTQPIQCLWANTSAIAVRREVIDRMGAFDVDLFGYSEDADFGWRANLFGYKVMSNPAAVATHAVHGTRDPAIRSDGGKIYLVWRNRIRSALVNYEWQNVLRYIVPYILLSLGHAFAKEPRAAKFRALWWNVVNLPGTLKRRRFVQKNRSVRDRELWHLFKPGLLGPGYDAVERAARAFSSSLPTMAPRD